MQRKCLELAELYARGHVDIEKAKVGLKPEMSEKKTEYHIHAENIGAVGENASSEGSIFITGSKDSKKISWKELLNELTSLQEKLKDLPGGQKAAEIVEKIEKSGVEAGSDKDAEDTVQEILEEGEIIASVVDGKTSPRVYELIKSANPEFLSPKSIARIEPWSYLASEDFIILAEKFGNHEVERTLALLQKYGICLIRFSGQYPSENDLTDFVRLFAQIAGSQNDYPGEVKTMRPDPKIDPNTGDSAQDLGFHVDGTQAENQPAVLVFQYVRTSDFGGNSRFVDLADVLEHIEEPGRSEILINLARKNAASFSKKDMNYKGPIFGFPDGKSLAGRMRFDTVMTCIEECQTDFQFLEEAITTRGTWHFKPEPGDIIIFDNWRVMHARTEIGGEAQRVHRRIWCNALAPQYQHRVQLGIRPLSTQLRADIEKANSSA